MAFTKKFSALVIILAALTMLIACGGRHDSEEHYYLVTANKSIPYWQGAANGFFEAARQMKVHAEVAGPDTYDPGNERDEFHKLLSKNPKPSGILVSPADPEMMKPEIDAAIAA